MWAARARANAPRTRQSNVKPVTVPRTAWRSSSTAFRRPGRSVVRSSSVVPEGLSSRSCRSPGSPSPSDSKEPPSLKKGTRTCRTAAGGSAAFSSVWGTSEPSGTPAGRRGRVAATPGRPLEAARAPPPGRRRPGRPRSPVRSQRTSGRAQKALKIVRALRPNFPAAETYPQKDAPRRYSSRLNGGLSFGRDRREVRGQQQ